MPVSIISLLNETQKQQLLAVGKPLSIEAGESLFEHGQLADQMFLVEKGKVTLYRLMPNGDEKLFKVFLAGGVIAEMAMFMQPESTL